MPREESMKPFDFAETRILERNYGRRYVSAKLRRIVALAALTVVVSAFSYAVKTVYAERVDHAKLKLAKVESLCSRARDEIATTNKDTTQHEWQADLAMSSRRVLGMVDTILRCAPEDVWLSRVQSLDKGLEVRVEGCASSFASLSDMISTLRETPTLAAVQLTHTRTVGMNGTEPVEFSLQLRTRNLDAPALEDRGAPSPARVPEVGRSY